MSDLKSAHAAIKRTALHLKRPWRTEINWNRGERQSPIVMVDSTEAIIDRALAWQFDPFDPLQLAIEGLAEAEVPQEQQGRGD